MPSKRDLSVSALKDMTPEERLDAAIILSVGSNEIFTDEEYVGLYNSLYNKNYTVADRNKEEIINPNVRSHLFMYMMTEKDVTPDEIAEMTADEIKAYVPDFKQAVADHPVYGEAAEKLSKEELENNIKWYGNMYGTAYKKITDEKFPDADQLGSEAGIASAFQNNTCAFSQVLETISYSENKINFRDVPMKEGMTKSSVSRLLNDAAMEASGNKDKGGNNIFFKASRAVKFSDLLYTVLDSDENIRTRALYKVILETEIVPDLADKDVSFEDKSLNALKYKEKLSKIYNQLDPNTGELAFKDFTDEECQKILSTPIKSLKIIEPDLYGKTMIKAAAKMPASNDFRIHGIAHEERKNTAEYKAIAEKAGKHRKEIYSTFENIARNGQDQAKFAGFIPEKNGKLDFSYQYFSSECLDNQTAFDKIFADALEQQKDIISEQLQLEDKYGNKPSEQGIMDRFVEGFRVSDPDSPFVTIPVMEAVKKYKDANPDSNINSYVLAKTLVMFDVKERRNVYYDPVLYAEDGPNMGKPIRASEDKLEPIQLHVYDLEKINSKSAQMHIKIDEKRNEENVENHVRRKKEAAEYKKIAEELRLRQEEYEAEYQRDLKAMADDKEKRKREALEKVRNKKYEEFKKAEVAEEAERKAHNLMVEEAEKKEKQKNGVPEPEEDEEEMFRQSEEAYQIMQQEIKDKEVAFRKGNKFCIDNLSEEDKKLYDIMDEDREELKKAIEIEKTKKPSKNKVNLPEGAEEHHGVSNEIWKELRESRTNLDEKRWFSWTGFGTSHELSRLKHQTDRLMEICKMTNERSYDDKYVRLRDEMVDKLEKEALAYDREKRGKKHLNDPNWEPLTPAGKKRFRSNKAILEFCKEYKKTYACKDEKILKDKSVSDKVVDVLEEKQWIVRLGDIDPERKPADPAEQQKVINEVEECAAGLLNAKYSNKFIKKEEISIDAAEMFFDVNAEKIQGSKVFSTIKTKIKGKDAWEKAMNLKKLAEKDGGAKLIESYSKAVIANKKAKNAAPKAGNAQPKVNTTNNNKEKKSSVIKSGK